ncbi:MAG: hypothetical protein WD652_00565 [Acidimicrobiia bacterium]
MRRRAGVVAALLLALIAVPGVASAHGIGGRSDLPVPLEYFLVGAAVVVLLSFGALAVLWPVPRLQDGPRPRGRGWLVPKWLSFAGAGLGVFGLALIVTAGLFGDESARSNIAPAGVWVVLWLVLPFLAAGLGNIWAVLNPWRTLGRIVRLDGPPGPGRWGVWPATVAFIAIVWIELVYPRSGDPGALGLAAAFYTVVILGLAVQVGIDRAVTSTEAFTVYHRLLSAIAPFGRRADGRIGRRGWFRALTVLPQWPGLGAFVVAMIGTVTYDGLSGTPWWDDLSFTLVGTAQHSMWFQTLALLVVVGVIGGAYLAASWWASRIAGPGGLGAVSVARSFAHTLVPIALAYAFAHYFTLIAFEGQLLIPAMSDPVGLGWNLFGTVDYQPNYTWIPPVAVWWIQLAAIVGGHVVGVVLAHDRALAVFAGPKAVRTQYALLTLMVALTALGLTVLAAG